MIRWRAPSELLSLDDEPYQPSRRLFSIGAMLAQLTPDITHPLLDARPEVDRRWYKTFPGEHYNLLTALAQILRPAIAWEFGTFTGMGTVALREGLDPSALLYTVDLVPRQPSWLVGDKRVIQIIADMKSPYLFEEGYAQLLRKTGLIFVDGPKDIHTELAFIEQLDQIRFASPPIVVFDDIREPTMIDIWRNIRHPKMDFTSYGHFTGTGLVDWTPL